MPTLGQIYKQSVEKLKGADADSPALAARRLIASVTGLEDSAFITDRGHEISAVDAQSIHNLIDRRVQGEPVDKILGQTWFWGLPFKVTKDVLAPRPDSETLIEAALKAYEGREAPRTILDLGTGSGCLLVTLLREWPQAQGTGVDLSEAALAVAAENADLNGVAGRVRFIQSRWTEKLTESFDLIIANPPYIPSADIPNLQKEVRNHDPILALDGGADGLEAYKNIFSEINRVLDQPGRAFLEVGISQAQHVKRLAVNAGFVVENVHADLAGIPRVVEISTGEK